ncbi:minor capsid protein [Streptosporangium sp. NPDC087985]|uniref:minor capsid protein n=1 Tax=Streptosporangium sp. NPDC087985 TaxID=3366196 RepID=UPI0037F2AE97
MAQRSELKLNLSGLDAKMKAGAVKGLQVAMEHLLQKSQEQVPHEEGALERSGTPSVDEGALKGAVSYDTPYATIQHEDLTLKHDDGRKAKYLEDPFDSEQQKMQELIAAQIRRALR